MGTITLTGDQGYEAFKVSGLDSGTVIDASGASWIHDNDDGDGASSPYPFQVYDAPDVVIEGGTILGRIDQDGAWRDVYDLGNAAAVRTEDTPNVVIRDWRITETWDAIRVSWNSQDFLIEDVWVTDARDDAVENDRLQSGTIRDSLFDGVYAGLSIDPSSSSPVDGSDEVVTMEGVLLRLETTSYNGMTTHGSPIKTDSATDGEVTPSLRFIDCVFAIEDVEHRSYRSMFDAWDHTIESHGNVYLNLSDTPLPDDYPMPPDGWTVLEGQEARDYWTAARDTWIAAHDGDADTPDDLPDDPDPEPGPDPEPELPEDPAPDTPVDPEPETPDDPATGWQEPVPDADETGSDIETDPAQPSDPTQPTASDEGSDDPVEPTTDVDPDTPEIDEDTPPTDEATDSDTPDADGTHDASDDPDPLNPEVGTDQGDADDGLLDRTARGARSNRSDDENLLEKLLDALLSAFGIRKDDAVASASEANEPAVMSTETSDLLLTDVVPASACVDDVMSACAEDDPVEPEDFHLAA